ncbi:MAG: hypothetical protein P8N66_05595, partial [Porticoccaceae bacterium]|nr:hypothetical protein [Porticoccaceae bacterium]
MTRFNLLKSILFTFGFCGITTESYSDDTSQNIEIETITVTGRRNDQNISELIGSVASVTSEELERISHAHIKH